MSTSENLEKAMYEEGAAVARYLALAEKADQEGFGGLARLLRAAARSASVHAMSHCKAMGASGDVAAMVEEMAAEEKNKSGKTYPAMVQEAVRENEIDARHSLEYAMSIQMMRAKQLKKAARDPASVPEAAYYVCPVCGHTAENEPPKKCPYCGVDGSRFMEVT